MPALKTVVFIHGCFGHGGPRESKNTLPSLGD
ncbi:MAG: hypothetical protein H7A06_00160 [Pseudomonadales bacterium]|nr:hypothetical protein [Pseudomonadales bacterium]